MSEEEEQFQSVAGSVKNLLMMTMKKKKIIAT